MRVLFVDFRAFLADVFWHWQSWLSGSGFGGAVLIVIALWEKATGKSMDSYMYLSIVLGAFLFGSFFVAWRSKYQELKALQEKLKSPEMGGDITAILTTSFEPIDQDTIVVVELRVVNSLGPSSAVLDWCMTIEFPDSRVLTGEVPLLPQQGMSMLILEIGSTYNLAPLDYVVRKAMQPIVAGGVVEGWFWSVFRNIQSEKFYEDRATVAVSFSDVISRKRYCFRRNFGELGIHIRGLPASMKGSE